MPAAESYPDDLRYHPEHDWARIDGDEATMGITWFAQDSLGELVHYEAPEVGSTVAKDQACGEVESDDARATVFSRNRREFGERARLASATGVIGALFDPIAEDGEAPLLRFSRLPD